MVTRLVEMKEGLRFVSKDVGGQSVMILGIIGMLKLCVGNLVLEQQVIIIAVIYSMTKVS